MSDHYEHKAFIYNTIMNLLEVLLGLVVGNDKAVSMIDAVKHFVGDLQCEVYDLKQTLDDAMPQIERLTGVISSLRDELEQKKEDYNSLKADLKQVENEKMQLAERMNDLYFSVKLVCNGAIYSDGRLKKIMLIKLYRTITRYGLKESKLFVENCNFGQDTVHFGTCAYTQLVDAIQEAEKNGLELELTAAAKIPF